jgi:hypothetical protein
MDFLNPHEYITDMIHTLENINTIFRCGLFLLLSVFFISPLHAGTDTAKVRSMINAVSSDSLFKHIHTLERAGGFYNRISYTPGNDTVVRYIYNTFKGYKRLTTVEYDTFYMATAPFPYNQKPLVNIVATLKGKKEPDKYIMVGGHLDCSASRIGTSDWPSKWETISAPGADDNATGVAAVLELARIFSDSTLGFSNDYSLVFIAFGNEEGVPNNISPGLSGSAHFSQEAKSKGMNILGLINLDMLGYNPIKIYADIVSNAASVWIGQQCIDANNLYRLGITTNPAPFIEGGYSDHYTFWQNGYPAILLIEHAWPWTTDINYPPSPHYHKPSDTLGTLNIPMIRALTQMTLGALASIGTSNATAVHEHSRFPEYAVLIQNYPNPFNGITNYELRITNEECVSMKIYDALGREISVLVNEVLQPGTYRMHWDAVGFASGVYYYRITAGEFRQTKSMILMK